MIAIHAENLPECCELQKGIKDWREEAAIAYEHRWGFRSFGAVAYGLGFVPVLSWLLNFVTTIGAALWAADIERGHKLLRA